MRLLTKSIIIAFRVIGAVSIAQSQWSVQPSGTTETLLGVQFVDANTGIAVGTSGKILRTTNGGSGWLSQTSGTTRFLRDVAFPDVSTGFAVGEPGIILRTTNGGTAWTSQTSGTASTLYPRRGHEAMSSFTSGQ